MVTWFSWIRKSELIIQYSLERWSLQLGSRRFLGTWRITARKICARLLKVFRRWWTLTFFWAGSITRECCQSDEIRLDNYNWKPESITYLRRDRHRLPIVIALFRLMGTSRVLQNHLRRKVRVHQRQNTFESLARFSSPKSSMYREIGKTQVAEGLFPENTLCYRTSNTWWKMVVRCITLYFTKLYDVSWFLALLLIWGSKLLYCRSSKSGCYSTTGDLSCTWLCGCCMKL